MGMKILVEKKDGSKEIITLVPPLEIFDKPEFSLHHFHCGDGMDHYFHADTGHYDGWGMAVRGDEKQAMDTIKRVEDSRESQS